MPTRAGCSAIFLCLPFVFWAQPTEAQGVTQEQGFRELQGKP